MFCKTCKLIKNEQIKKGWHICSNCRAIKRHNDYIKNKQRDLKRNNEYKLKNKEKISSQNKIYYSNKEIKFKIQEYNKIWRLKNKKKINEKRKIYLKNPNNRIVHNLRNRLSKLIRKKYKTSHSKDLLGCTIKFLIKYLELKFTKNMNWNNYGKWHVDHIIPCNMFNLKNIEEQKICFNYKNLQPLWATTEIAKKYGESENYIGNLEKGNKII